MKKVTVFYFECYDTGSHEMVRSKRPATRAAIARCKGVAIEETANEVEESWLDGDGFIARDKMEFTGMGKL
jgi:hypothetical protein